MASGPITSWQTDGKTMEAVRDFIFLDSKITADGDSNQRTLAPWKESYENLDSILKSRDLTLLMRVCIVKAMIFPVVMYGCESWSIKKAEHQRLDAFELWCWKILLRVPWTARRSNQSIQREISPEISLTGLMLKLKLQYFGHLMQRANSLEKTLMLEKIESKRRRGQQLDGITDSMDVESEQAPGVGDGQGSLAWCSSWDCKELDTTDRLNNNKESLAACHLKK